MAKIICGFPGIGKTTITDKYSTAIDLDSAAYSRSPDFPVNYLFDIRAAISDGYEYILISTHSQVLEMLTALHMDYTLVYPDESLKEEYMKRYVDRESPKGFINYIDEMWDEFVLACDYVQAPTKFVLQSGEYLSDVFEKI